MPMAFTIWKVMSGSGVLTSDYYRPKNNPQGPKDYYQQSPKNNPQGPKDSYDPQEPGAIKRVQRGGSFLCNDQYCERYKAGSPRFFETFTQGSFTFPVKR